MIRKRLPPPPPREGSHRVGAAETGVAVPPSPSPSRGSGAAPLPHSCPSSTMASSSLPPRSSSASYLKKENSGPARRQMGFKERPSRNVPSAIRNGEANGGTPSASVGGGGGAAEAPPVVEFSGRDDVHRLLAEKMKGKSKSDYKGRCDQMSEYIKKLRACIRWYMELEDGYLAEKERLRGSIDAENTRHTELEAQLGNAIEELKAANLDLTRRCQSLEMALVQGSPPWSDLPPELLSMVFLRLPTRADRAFFPVVCRTWCSAARQSRLPPPSPVPWILQPSAGTVTSMPPGETFRFPDGNGVRYHTSCGAWFVLSPQNDDSCFLMNPFTRATMPLPRLSSYSYYEHPVELGDGMDPDIDSEETWRLHNNDEIFVTSLVVCSTRLIAAIVSVQFGSRAAIALCRPGAAAWSVSAHDECRELSHMVFFQGKLYALYYDHSDYRTEDLIRIDIVDEHDSDVPRVSRIDRLLWGPMSIDTGDEDYCLSYLLESNGSLLVVRRNISFKADHCGILVGSSKLEVLKADLEQHMWADVRTLGNDQALFLGQGCSKAVSVSPYDLSRDCIFFLDDCPGHDGYYFEKTHKYSKIISCGVYDMKDEKTYSPLPMAPWIDGKGTGVNWIFWHGSSVDTAALFDSIEGGIRAPAYSSREFMSRRMTKLCTLTCDIHEEVENHNQMLDRMGNDMGASRGFLSGMVNKFKMISPQDGYHGGILHCCLPADTTLPSSSKHGCSGFELAVAVCRQLQHIRSIGPVGGDAVYLCVAWLRPSLSLGLRLDVHATVICA
ncbi:hypothetical protein U9M48_037988 [Paspalum notatum var. saurae]|uniref:DUF295 domain-containing protein n=1 Tax=Paspalum notatum var. saurae TaxID=547442 RepID=A0AAQ3UG58_PASNO